MDVVCLCNSGNVWDACILAATAALLDSKFRGILCVTCMKYSFTILFFLCISARVPVVQTDSGSPLVDLSSTPSSLKLGSPPLTASFAVLKLVLIYGNVCAVRRVHIIP